MAAKVGKSNVVVGPFVFDQSVFDWANQQIGAALASPKTDSDCIVIDEVGHLEVKRKLGLYSSLVQALPRQDKKCNVILVARQSIRPAVMAEFGLSASEVEELNMS